MAYLRMKQARGRSYAYLVESRWDRATGQPKQRVLAYLGRLDRLRPGAIPLRYRTPANLRALEARVSAERGRLERGAAGEGARFVRALLDGDRSGARRLSRAVIRDLGAEAFYSALLVPSFEEIGRRVADGRLSVSGEHLATGLASGILVEMNAAVPDASPGSPEVVLCLPEGESHAMALLIAEGILRQKGYRTLNVAGSAPNRSVVEFVRVRRPVAALISVTLPDRLTAARRLARQLCLGAPGIRVAIGGRATVALAAGTHGHGSEIVRGPVEEFLRTWPDAAAPSSSA
jgi:methanogenic corrinoid protein MtbC1